MKKLVSHLSYSRVVSTLALFIALGGGAYALSLGKNEVKSRHIAKGAVKSSDVAKNTLKGSDVKQDSLKGSDILESTFDIGQFSAAASTPFDPAGPIRCDPEFGSGPPFVPCGAGLVDDTRGWTDPGDRERRADQRGSTRLRVLQAVRRRCWTSRRSRIAQGSNLGFRTFGCQ